MKTVITIHHGDWTTEIRRIASPLSRYRYRVTTSSGRHSIKPETLASTLERARQAAAQHIEEVLGL
jgi:hypothetical protein